MNKFQFGVSVLGLTTVGLLPDSVNHKVVANEAAVEAEKQQTATHNSEITQEHQPIVREQVTPELVNEQMFSSSTEITPKPGSVSYDAVDLKPESDFPSDNTIAARPIDLDEFCQNYPFNSRCTQRPVAEPKPEVGQPSTNKTEISQKASSWAINPEISTLGLGASVIKSVTPNLNARVGLNTLSIDVGGYRKRQNEVTYDANLKLLNVSTLVDYHPSKKSGFRMSAGLIFNDNKVEGDARIRDGQVFEYNSNRYTREDIRSVKGKVSFPNSVAPYIGIGWGNPVKPGKRWGFSANLGVMFVGSPQVDLTADIANNALREQILRDLRVEKKELEDDLDVLKIYPVLSIKT